MLMYGEGHKQGGSQSCCCSVSSLVDALPCGGRPDVLQQHAGQLAPVLDTSHNLHTTRQPSYSLVFMLRSMPSEEDEDLLLFSPCICVTSTTIECTTRTTLQKQCDGGDVWKAAEDGCIVHMQQRCHHAATALPAPASASSFYQDLDCTLLMRSSNTADCIPRASRSM